MYQNVSKIRQAERISAAEKELVGDELIYLAEWLRKRYKLSIPEARLEIREILSVSV